MRTSLVYFMLVLRDRDWLLEIEQQLVSFSQDAELSSLTFPQMTSYHRMLIHRVATFFGLDHCVGQSGKCVVVSKQSQIHALPQSFAELAAEIQPTGSKRVIVLRRGASSETEESSESSLNSPLFSAADGPQEPRFRSIEERQADYVAKRARIFHSQDHSGFPSPGASKDQKKFKNGNGRRLVRVFALLHFCQILLL